VILILIRAPLVSTKPLQPYSGLFVGLFQHSFSSAETAKNQPKNTKTPFRMSRNGANNRRLVRRWTFYQLDQTYQVYSAPNPKPCKTRDSNCRGLATGWVEEAMDRTAVSSNPADATSSIASM
jgi:hypothetical protein